MNQTMKSGTNSNTTRSWGITWTLAFLGFPIGGAIASMIAGPMQNPIVAAQGGMIAGAIIGAAQMLALRNKTNLSWEWPVASASGLALGLALSVALIGADTSLNAALSRAPITGLTLGLAQWLILRRHLKQAWIWPLGLALIYVPAWYLTAMVIGNSMGQSFFVFGASGALLHQVLTGLILWRLQAQDAQRPLR